MTTKAARSIQSVQWFPAERLGQMNVEPTLRSVDRGSYEYAWLPVDDPLTARAMRDAEVKPEGLWARRSRVALRGAPLLMQEVFLPGMGQG